MRWESAKLISSVNIAWGVVLGGGGIEVIFLFKHQGLGCYSRFRCNDSSHPPNHPTITVAVGLDSNEVFEVMKRAPNISI